MHLRSIFAYFRGFFVLLGLFFLILYVWKLSGSMWLSGVSDHLSNFALTGLFSLVFIGPRAFSAVQGRARVFLVVGLFVAANLIVELAAPGALGGFNILDGYDALYGIFACVIVVCAHVIAAKRKALA